MSEHGYAPGIVAGLSIGAYPAAVIAGALPYADALRLVALRGQLMERAYPAGYGMTAVIGMTQRALERLIAEVNSAATPVFLANINAETQMVVAGSDAAMQRLATLAAERGAHRCERLDVAVPSHCALLDESAAGARRCLCKGHHARASHRVFERQHRAAAFRRGAHRVRSRRQHGAAGALARHDAACVGTRRPPRDRDAAGQCADPIEQRGFRGRDRGELQRDPLAILGRSSRRSAGASGRSESAASTSGQVLLAPLHHRLSRPEAQRLPLTWATAEDREETMRQRSPASRAKTADGHQRQQVRIALACTQKLTPIVWRIRYCGLSGMNCTLSPNTPRTRPGNSV